MSSSALCFLMVTLCLILGPHSSLAANAKAEGTADSNENGLIDELCNETVKEKFSCLNILRADPSVVQAKDAFGLAKAVLELGINKGKEGQKFLKGLASKSRSPAISLCADKLYAEFIASLSSALRELKEDPQTANYDAKVAGDGPKSCDSALAKGHIVNPDISSLNQRTSLLSFVAFLATDKVSG